REASDWSSDVCLFRSGRDPSEDTDLPELRHAAVLHRERDLEMVAGHGLVIDEGSQTHLRQALAAQAYLETARTRTVEGRGRVAGGGAGPAELGIGLGDHRRLGAQVEE